MASTFTYEGISAGDYAHQHNGNVYNTITNHYTIHQQRSDQSSGNSEKSKALLKAAKEGQTHRVNLLIQLGADRDYTDPQGWIALQHASLGGFEDLADALITKHGLDVNAVSTHGTPLCLAALKARVNIVEMLLKHRANSNAPGRLLGSALHAACCSGNVSIVSALLDAGAAPEAAMTVAITVGITGLINTRGLDIPALAHSTPWKIAGCRPLHIAISNNNHSVIEILHKRGIDFKAIASAHDPTNVYYSVTISAFWFCTSSVCAEVLMRNGGDVNWEGQRPGRSALVLAVARSSDTALLQVLIRNGALVNAQDAWGNTALHAAATFNRSAQAAALLQSGADLKITSKLGQTPLEVAAAVKADRTLACSN